MRVLRVPKAFDQVRLNLSLDRSWVLNGLVTIALFFFMAVVMLAIAMSRGLNRDENHFIAAGALLARDGLLPYRDYPYFHVPNLAFVYGVLFKWTDHLLLSSRLFSSICAWLSLVLIYLFSFWESRRHPTRVRLATAIGVTFLVFANPLFRNAFWRAWNHSFPVLLTIVAFLLYRRSCLDKNPALWLLGSGLAVCLAAGARLTFAPTIGALFLAIVVEKLPRLKWKRIAWFSLGVVLGALPVAALFCLAPRQFIFGNLTYNARLYREQILSSGLAGQTTVEFKLWYLFSHILANPGNAALVACLCYFLFRSRSADGGDHRDLLTLGLVLLSLLAGAMAPAIPLPQYFYAMVPLLAMGLPVGISRTPQFTRNDALVLFSLVILSIISTERGFHYLANLARPKDWTTLKIHRAGQQVRSTVEKGRLLTFAPVVPLEGGLPIYPELATGPFAWVIAPFVNAEERKVQRIPSAQGLADLFQGQLPAGILFGAEPALEEPLTDFAKAHGYTPKPVDLGYTVFRAP
jgi:hypothetical protein